MAEQVPLAGAVSCQVAAGAAETAGQRPQRQEVASGAMVTASLEGRAAGWSGAQACSEG